MTRSRGDPLVAFIGYALMGVGAIMVALCGTCTALAGIPLLFELASGGDGRTDYYDLPSVGILGVIPTVMGIGLCLGGRALGRSADGDPK